MSRVQQPSFEEWVRYCFTQGYADFCGTSFDGEGSILAREEKFQGLDAITLTNYLTRLFESPAFIAESYTDDQIADATWFVFGCASGYLSRIRMEAIPSVLQSRCMLSIATAYTDLFDHVCGRRGKDTDSDLRESVRVDGAVYMIWDMGQLSGAVMFPEDGPHLAEAGIQVLQSVLNRCRTSACLVSALHGIGHIYGAHRRGGNETISDRLLAMVNEFLEHRHIPGWLREYAFAARDGNVQ